MSALLVAIAFALAPRAVAAVRTQTASAPAAAWPKLDKTRADEVREKIVSLKRTLSADGVETMSARIVEYGKGAVPILYESLARANAEETERCLRPLERLVDEGDGARLAADCASKAAPVRVFALRKAAEMKAAEALPAARKALADREEDVRLEAALACSSLGTTDGLEVLRAAARERWPQLGKRIRTALERHRSEEATKLLVPGLGSKDWKESCASLRLLAGVGMKSAAPDVARLLDSEDNRVKEDAINALRGMIDGERPIEKLSAFDLAEQANAWKKRV
ncbi:MAG TPA: HEAT repeat domain-containing protein [Planctomycetota bacterium]|nr:HEAT repeat domain-containing protein [Planctomycetota bacterium]